MKVSLFVTCLADQLSPRVGLATVKLLRRLGCEVAFPRAQVCCGQPAWNAGYAADARTVARGLLDAFAGAEHVVAPSGSCAGMIRHNYAELFAGDRDAARAAAFAGTVVERSQFLVNVMQVTDVGASFPHRVAYHPSCHGTRLLGVGEEPLKLLRAVKGLELVPLARAEDCCGFGGTFATKLDAVSAAMADEKLEHVAGTRAEYLVGTDLGCLLHVGGRLSRRGRPVRPIHLAEVLAGGEEGA